MVYQATPNEWEPTAAPNGTTNEDTNPEGSEYAKMNGHDETELISK